MSEQDEDEPVPLEIDLLPRVDSELEMAQALTGHSRPDVVNRAITLYAAVVQVVTLGRGRYRATMVHSDGSLIDVTIRRSPRWRKAPE
jgi:hypothetical protein